MRTPPPDAELEQLWYQARGAERTANRDLSVGFGGGPMSASNIPAGIGPQALGAVGTNRT